MRADTSRAPAPGYAGRSGSVAGIDMRFRSCAVLVLAALLAACSSTPPVADTTTAAPTPEASEAYRRKSDCTGQCLAGPEVAAGSAATGSCQRDVRQNFGCRQRIDDGKAQGTICVD